MLRYIVILNPTIILDCTLQCKFHFHSLIKSVLNLAHLVYIDIADA